MLVTFFAQLFVRIQANLGHIYLKQNLQFALKLEYSI